VRIVSGVSAAVVAAGMVLCACDCASAGPAADDAGDDVAPIDRLVINQYMGGHLPPDSAQLSAPAVDRELADRFLYFGGMDLWRNGGFVHGGVVWSPDGLDRPGFTFKLLVAGGRYQYRSGTVDIVGTQGLAAAMPGWRFKVANLEILVLGGLDLQSHRLAPDDPANALRGTHVGGRVNVDVWYQPTDKLMAALSLSGSSVDPNLWTRAAVGWRLYDLAWVGPEGIVFTDARYQEYRAGVHVTSLRTGPVELSLGLGYVIDSDHRAGAYGRLGILTRQ